MQRLLRDMLNDPPYNLARFANLLLIVCAILLGSIFLLHTEKKDITLNLSLGSEEEIMVDGEAQVAVTASGRLYPFAMIGQDLERGDTLFLGIPKAQFQEMTWWVKKLNDGGLIPTKEMLNKYPLPADIRAKMIDLAKQDANYKGLSRGKLDLADADRMIRVKELIAQLEQDIRDLNAAIPKFEALAKSKEAKYFSERDRHARREIELDQLVREKEKWDDAKRDIVTRQNQLRTAKGELFEYNSELNFFSKKKPISTKQKKQDLVPSEQDLARSLDSLLKSQIVLSSISGKIATFGGLENVQARDTLVYLGGSMQRASRSNTIIADANTADAKYISVNSISNIILKDGSSVQGTIRGFDDSAQGSDSIVHIDAEEAVSYADIEEIIVPAKNTNFIKKVMQNF